MSLIIRPGDPLPPVGQPQVPLKVAVDPNTGAVSVTHTPSGSQVLFGGSGIIAMRDTFGTIIQTTVDGALQFRAKKIQLITDDGKVELIQGEAVASPRPTL